MSRVSGWPIVRGEALSNLGLYNLIEKENPNTVSFIGRRLTLIKSTLKVKAKRRIN